MAVDRPSREGAPTQWTPASSGIPIWGLIGAQAAARGCETVLP
jgi:hypothetical protein